MSSTNQVKNSVVIAGQDGTIAYNETWRHVRTTNEGLTWNKTVSPSTEIQQSRNVQDMVDIGAQGGGTVAAEMHTPTADTDAFVFLQSLMCNSFQVSRVRAPSGFTLAVDGTGQLALSAMPGDAGSVLYVDGLDAGINGPWILASGANGGGTGTRPAGYTANPAFYPVPTRQVPVATSVERIGVKLSTAITITVSNGSATIDFGASVGINAGDWFSLQNTEQAANAGFYRAKSVSGNVVSCEISPVGVMAEAGTANAYLFRGVDIKNGTSPQWFNFNSINYGDDGSALGKIRTGARVGQTAFSFDANNIASATHTLMYMSEIVQNSDPNTSDITITSPALSARANVAMISVGAAALSGMAAVKTLTLTVNNNLRAQTGLGSYGLVGIGDGTFTVTGNLSAYFQTQGLYQTYMAGGYFPIHWGIGKNGGYLFFSLPKCKMTSAQNSAKGLNQDLTNDIAFQAQQADTGAYTMQMSYFPWVGSV